MIRHATADRLSAATGERTLEGRFVDRDEPRVYTRTRVSKRLKLLGVGDAAKMAEQIRHISLGEGSDIGDMMLVGGLHIELERRLCFYSPDPVMGRPPVSHINMINALDGVA